MRKYLTLILLSGLFFGMGFGQSPFYFSSDFAWAASSSVTSDQTYTLSCSEWPQWIELSCTSPYQRNYSSQGSPLSNGHPTTSALIPYPLSSAPLQMTITLTFSPPVADLSLLIRDLDDDVPAVGPEETASNFQINGQPMQPVIVPTQGTYTNVSNLVTPLAANCNGWFKFPSSGISSLSFDYWRVASTYALLLDSLRFRCDSTITALAAPSSSFAFQISPNPTSDFLDLNLHNERTMAAEIRITDLTGRVIQTLKFKGSKMRIEVRDFPDGIYFLEIGEGKQRNVSKFVVAH